MKFLPSTSLLRRTWRLGLLAGVLSTIAFLAIGNSSLLARLVADQAVALVGQRSDERSEKDDDDTDGETTKLEITPGLIRHSLRRSRAEGAVTVLPRFAWLCPDRISLRRMAESVSSFTPAPFHDGCALPLRC
jgi:hypothetical protein